MRSEIFARFGNGSQVPLSAQRYGKERTLGSIYSSMGKIGKENVEENFFVKVYGECGSAKVEDRSAEEESVQEVVWLRGV